MHLADSIKDATRHQTPVYFAMVMATGIVSLAAHLLGMPAISQILFWINNAVYIILLLILASRMIFYSSNFFADMKAHRKSAGFFTVVAATSVLGIQHAMIAQNHTTAILLWIWALLLWLVFVYAFFTIMALQQQDTVLSQGINGVWLVMAVATQSIAILGAINASHFAWPPEWTLFTATALFFVGGFFYAVLITLIFYSFTFFKTEPRQIEPTYWINMGAVAISTLAGATLINNIAAGSPLAALLPYIKGSTLLFWSISTWWIPVIIILDIWKYRREPQSLRYNPNYWSMVFCLGMYTVCTWQMADALRLPFIKVIPAGFVYIALLAWLLAFIGLCIRIAKIAGGAVASDARANSAQRS